MNPILLSFLCGAAFIGGAVATTILVFTVVSLKDRQIRAEMVQYWKDSLEKQERQLLLLESMVSAVDGIKERTGKPQDNVI
jgi:hypothetical protein